ncbi:MULTISPECIES: hypothetical protein [unclassified Variovorax]|uniref:hypothetical protein n=1 Tax=unclassified Variovorax TaxID=663243 RepID=UPI0011601E9F|nr:MULTISPECIES: hypothetical protein [unclassified Variovorax]
MDSSATSAMGSLDPDGLGSATGASGSLATGRDGGAGGIFRAAAAGISGGSCGPAVGKGGGTETGAAVRDLFFTGGGIGLEPAAFGGVMLPGSARGTGNSEIASAAGIERTGVDSTPQ